MLEFLKSNWLHYVITFFITIVGSGLGFFGALRIQRKKREDDVINLLIAVKDEIDANISIAGKKLFKDLTGEIVIERYMSETISSLLRNPIAYSVFRKGDLVKHIRFAYHSIVTSNQVLDFIANLKLLERANEPINIKTIKEQAQQLINICKTVKEVIENTTSRK
jgi:hypothetical protein